MAEGREAQISFIAMQEPTNSKMKVQCPNTPWPLASQQLQHLLFVVFSPLPSCPQLGNKLCFQCEKTHLWALFQSVRKVLPYNLCKSTTRTLLLLLKRIEIWKSKHAHGKISFILVCDCVYSCVCLYIWPNYMIMDLYTGHSAAINRCQPQRGKYKMQMQNDKTVKYFVWYIIYTIWNGSYIS